MHIWDCPPYPYLEVVASHCPRALKLYMELWKERDEFKRVLILDKELPIRFLLRKKQLVNQLLLLVREGVLSFEESQDKLTIELTDWDESFMEEDGAEDQDLPQMPR